MDVTPFTLAYQRIQAQMVDTAIQYDCPYDGKSYMLVVNAIHVPSMLNNLIPSFMMRETGITVNIKAKIHIEDPNVEDHAIIFKETGFCIPLSLWGVFSYFSSTSLM